MAHWGKISQKAISDNAAKNMLESMLANTLGDDGWLY